MTAWAPNKVMQGDRFHFERLWLSPIAFNPGNLRRRLVPPKRIDNWMLTSFQRGLVKTGGRLVKQARYYWLLLGESYAFHQDEMAFDGSTAIQLERNVVRAEPRRCIC